MNFDDPGHAVSKAMEGRPCGAASQGPDAAGPAIPDRQDRRLRELWQRISNRLGDAGAVDAGLEAEVLLRHALGVDRSEYYAVLNGPVPFEQAALAESLAERRAGGEPLAYITGRREFYGLEFLVDERVLVPRQETELLVDLALAACATRCGERAVIADVGTGSGAIAVTLANRQPDAVVYATDLSGGALEVAGANAERHGVAERVRLLRGDLLSPLPERADVIVSNPPYIPTGERSGLPRDVRREPSVALDGGSNGTEVIARLLEQAPRYLEAGGALFVEMAPEQRDAVMRIAERSFPSAEVEVVRDAAGQCRVLAVRTGGN